MGTSGGRSTRSRARSEPGYPPAGGALEYGAAIEIRGVRKRFGAVQAVRGLDLVVRRGSVTALLGPNGCGKTTTLRMVLAILQPDEGAIRVLGHDRVADARSRIGYLPEDRGLYKDLTVGQLLTYLARLRGVPSSGLQGKVAGWLERVGLADRVHARCGVLSRGQQQRVQAVAALLHEPDLLILDEPFNGLDPVNRRTLAELFAEQRARGCTTIFSTHLLQHAEEVCDHVVMMHCGEKVLDAPLAEVRVGSGAAAVVCEPLDPAAGPAPLEGLPGVACVRRVKRAFRVELREGVDPSALLALAAAAMPLARVEIERASLDDVFVEIVEREGSGA